VRTGPHGARRHSSPRLPGHGLEQLTAVALVVDGGTEAARIRYAVLPDEQIVV
jgi:hypothetical protein